jgi:hypothetical protein
MDNVGIIAFVRKQRPEGAAQLQKAPSGFYRFGLAKQC